MKQLVEQPPSWLFTEYPRCRDHNLISGMLSNLENVKGVNLEHAVRVLDGLGLTMLVVPKARAPWLEQAAAYASRIGEEAVWEPHASVEA